MDPLVVHLESKVGSWHARRNEHAQHTALHAPASTGTQVLPLV